MTKPNFPDNIILFNDCKGTATDLTISILKRLGRKSV
jgi:hypothetical protein